jgi:membrane protease YdiL (CAAX protease family)
MTFTRNQIALTLEFLLVFAGLPLLVLTLKDRGFMIMLLWCGALVVYAVMHRWYERKHGTEWNWPGLRAGWKSVALRFACLAPLITAITWFAFRDGHQFLSFPRDRPDIWIKVMVLYPLLSVWPQEIIYRSFIRHRYAPLFKTRAAYIAASAIAFGFMHILFLNPVAITMTLIGGVLFAHSYYKHQSLALACLEHALYGCLIFTIGLGQFFFSGAAWG